ncbi:class I SAM-dependent methyltransferase [Wenzhouxiangella sp. AB-CW3]|uniref:class I SAM-dependent methyltransferase n=1 Tax=Wenzhouxiangella sp. AB-CW3 TaxID=2771012 RepID=UPI00168A77A2|nr:class I SAM-dependent methyltransferase [Wenzhouxiangella sp. AB-CW3]QOC23743.1 class I SAM-dependent methyltransferase [Wenzhouxiangella sp. AB-CW3]
MEDSSKIAATVAAASFRDPSGFVFRQDGVVYRQVNQRYREDYHRLIDSGLYQKLVERGLLIPHEEVDGPVAEPDTAYRILRPEPLEFLSWPYEWSFSQLKDAALATLEIQRLAMQHDMSLKDASAYNIQFHRGRPVMIDTLSFEVYREGEPWVAYRQFCQHFLAPLALMARRDIRLGQLLRVHIDGIPLDLAAGLLPRRTRLRPGLAMHLHLHARYQRNYADAAPSQSGKSVKQARVSRTGLLGMVDSLRGTISKLNWNPGGTEWADYYQATNYSEGAFTAKQALVDRFLDAVSPEAVWDLGANTGEFSRIAARRDIPVVAFDIDPSAVEKNYRRLRAEQQSGPLPLLLDLTNPSPGTGWHERERDSFLDRGPVDCAMALALIHHLAISNNVPLDRLADFFADACRHLIIEFVPRGDSQVQRLLSTREDIFDTYDAEHFEAAMTRHFEILEREPVEGSERTLYLMRRRR